MAAAFKQTTNITGLDVCRTPKQTLNRIYGQLSKILSKMPPEAAYRKHTEEVMSRRSAILNSTDDIKQIEEKIGCGQVEELIEQAKNELNCARFFLVTAPWEKLISPIPKNQWKWPIA